MGLISGSNQSAFVHGGLEVVQDQAPGHPAEVPEGVLQAAEEVVGGLAVDGLAVALAGVAQDDAEDVGLAPLAVGADDRGAGAEVDLGLVAGVALDATEGQVVRLLRAGGRSGGRSSRCRRSRGRRPGPGRSAGR